LMETRDELIARKTSLQKLRGIAALQGEEFDSTEINAIETQLATLADAEVAAVEARRAEVVKQQQAEKLERQTKLCGLVADHLQDMQEAQEAARALAAAFARILERMQPMARTHREITNTSPPTCLNELEIARLLGVRLAAVLRGSLPLRHRQHLGLMTLNPGVCKADDDWHEIDKATFQKRLAVALEADIDE
jgi:multidrug efflux pump subunit AcrA (membrane-fusion protein)